MRAPNAAEASAMIAGAVLLLQVVRTAREIATKKEVADAADKIRQTVEDRDARVMQLIKDHNSRVEHAISLLNENTDMSRETLTLAKSTNGRVTLLEAWQFIVNAKLKIPSTGEMRAYKRIPITAKKKKRK